MADRHSFHVRRATLDDLETFTAQRLALLSEAQALVPGAELDALRGATRDAFRSSLERGTCLVWLACSASDGVVGSCALFLAERLPSRTNPSAVEGYISHVYVTPSWRRRGAGAAVVRAAMDEIAARRLGRIRLHATESGRALYEHLGFRLRENDMDWRAP